MDLSTFVWLFLVLLAVTVAVMARLDQIGEMATAVTEMTTAAPQLPALDTPEALRYAADVLDAADTDGDPAWWWNPLSLRKQANRLEREAEAAARADAEREARINATVTALSDFEEHNQAEMSLVQIATALDDLGYRLDPTQAKATS